eukprot:TRINITY_DN3320_c0_g1_i7.p1 TRINITY_DN3320_c0_g1~~TRINITY_DN3320_c0_g1_i7.p1  ORF type:complete len:263 (+),score=102.75 TRINITY_DN3320_c0_g1_i7:686-1474(+)
MFLSNNLSASIEDEKETTKSYSQMVLANEKNAKKAKMTISNVYDLEEKRQPPINKNAFAMSVQTVFTEDFRKKEKETVDEGTQFKPEKKLKEVVTEALPEEEKDEKRPKEEEKDERQSVAKEEKPAKVVAGEFIWQEESSEVPKKEETHEEKEQGNARLNDIEKLNEEELVCMADDYILDAEENESKEISENKKDDAQSNNVEEQSIKQDTSKVLKENSKIPVEPKSEPANVENNDKEVKAEASEVIQDLSLIHISEPTRPY